MRPLVWHPKEYPAFELGVNSFRAGAVLKVGVAVSGGWNRRSLLMTAAAGWGGENHICQILALRWLFSLSKGHTWILKHLTVKNNRPKDISGCKCTFALLAVSVLWRKPVNSIWFKMADTTLNASQSTMSSLRRACIAVYQAFSMSFPPSPF